MASAMNNNNNDPLMDKDGMVLCASCDRCRARKTKCDGARPCSNCASKYMKKMKLASTAGVDLAEFDCVYSPAKRRGPVPGRSGQTRKSNEISSTNVNNVNNNLNFNFGGALNNNDNNNNGMANINNNNMDWEMNAAPNVPAAAGLDPVVSAGLGHLFQQISQQPPSAQTNDQLNLLQSLQQRATGSSNDAASMPEPVARRLKRDDEPPDDVAGVPKTVTNNSHLLSFNNVEGNRLRAFYHLSVDELFHLPAIPTDEEYCATGLMECITPMEIPGTHLAALNASRFAEVALGAVVHQELELGFELSNAVVHCLRECVQEPVQVSYLYEVARAYFLLGTYRAFRGDMERYFKYRRVALTYAAQLKDVPATHKLLAAISFLDAWAYMMYNADEQLIPAVVDETVPPVQPPAMSADSSTITPEHMERLQMTEQRFGCKMTACDIACDPRNQNWFQGAPPVYLNNEAPLISRSLDGLACAVRTCCDQANTRFASMSRAAENGGGGDQPSANNLTPTTTAVMANENELCSRNILQSAGTFLRKHQTESATARFTTQGQATLVSAMSAFLEDPGESMEDAQIQSLLSVCNKAIENPLILFHAGPTYHMVTNAAILLCHLVNGMYKTKLMKGQLDSVEQAIFEDVLETLVAVSRLLKIHRRKLPVKLRCHKIPRPNLHEMIASSSNNIIPSGDDKVLIDLGETIMCACRGCQGFVLLGCSPCVAAERAQAAQAELDAEEGMEGDALEAGDLDRELDDLGAEFDLDDDALLGMISQLVANEPKT